MKMFSVCRNQWLCIFAIVALVLVMFSLPALASGGGGHGAETKGWESTDTARVLNFAVLAALIVFLFKKFGMPLLDGRIQGIQAQLDELKNKKQAAQKELDAYNEKLAHLEAEAEKIVAEYTRQGEDAKERILKEAALSADKLKEQATRNIHYEFERAKERLQAEVVEKALAKAEEILTAKITEEDQNRLVDEYLDKVVAA